MILLLSLMSLFFISCSSSGAPSLSDGTGSETVNTFTGVALHADGSGAEEATVWLINEDRRTVKSGSWIVDSTTTDINGSFQLSTSMEGTFSVQVSGNGEVDYRGGFENKSSENNLGTFTLTSGHVVTGFVKSGGSEITVVGTGCRADIGSDGSFLIKGIPSGTFALSADGAYCSGFKTTKDTVNMDTVIAQHGFTLLDDFQHANSMSILGWLLPKSNWDISLSPEVVIDPIAIEGSFGNIISFTESWEGRSVFFTMSSATPLDIAHLDLRLSLGQLWHYWDISTMSGISFMSKGVGKIRIYIEVEQSNLVTDVKDIGWDISLPGSWSEINLNVSDLNNNGAPMSLIEIERVLNSVTALGFRMETTGSDTIQFQSDNFSLLNIEAFDILK